MSEQGGTVGRYTLRQRLGTGGFGAVYRAYDPVLDREVALKVLHPYLAGEGTTRERFIREGRALARVKHPNVVTVYEAGEVGGSVYLATDLIEGISLEELLQVRDAIPLDEVLRLTDQIAAAVAAVHARGLIHRDIKPANVLIERESGRAVLLDLGIARDAANATVTGAEVLGTPAFMAPEQIDPEVGSVTPRTDVYQLGATVYALLAGRAPYAGNTTQVLVAVLNRPPPDLAALRPDIPPAVVTAISDAMAKDPAARPEDAPAFTRRLREAAASATAPTVPMAPQGVAAVSPTPETMPPSQERTRARSVATVPATGRRSITPLVIGLGLLGVAAAVLGALLLSRDGNDGGQATRDLVVTPVLTVAAPTASAAPVLVAAPSPAATATPAATPIPAATRTPAPSPASSPTPASRPTAAPDTPAGSLIGQRVTGCTYGVDFELAVVRAEWTKTVLDTTAPGNGMWVVAFVDVTNVGDKAESLVTRPLKVRDGRGREYNVKEYPPDPVDFSRAYRVKGAFESFQPGITEQTVLAFQVPQDAGPLTLAGKRDFC